MPFDREITERSIEINAAFGVDEESDSSRFMIHLLKESLKEIDRLNEALTHTKGEPCKTICNNCSANTEYRTARFRSA